MMRIFILFGVLMMLLCNFPNTVLAQRDATPLTFDSSIRLESARYDVTINAREPRVAHVRCILTPRKGSGETLLLYMSHFGTEDIHDGYARYLRDLTVTSTDGKELLIEALGKTNWTVTVGNKSSVTLSYKVLLTHDERRWPPGRSETPYVQDDCIFCPGYALFIVGEVRDIELRVDVPDNWHVSTPWYPIDGKEHRFSIMGTI